MPHAPASRAGALDSALPAKALVTIGQARFFIGYAFGMRQPSLIVDVSTATCNDQVITEIEGLLSGELGQIDHPPLNPTTPGLLSPFLRWVGALHARAGIPILDEARIVGGAAGDGKHATVHLPCLSPRATLTALAGLASWVSSVAGAIQAGSPTTPDRGLQLRPQIEALARTAPRGFNRLHFLTAAAWLQVPWSLVTVDVAQYGWGARSRWLSSSFTDTTSNIAAQLARDKAASAMVLRDAGLPMPRHMIAPTVDDALRHARSLGFPVVVKPADLDGGKGVTANIRHEGALRAAWAAASVLSKRVLVEQHIAGRDYRIQVVQGHVHGVLERVPGGVTGDGAASVRRLLERQNDERRTAIDDRRFLKPMSADAEAMDLLAQQDLSLDSVPAAGRFVRLRGAANVASGGVPVPVPLTDIHPDNLRLAQRAARTLRLDVAGIDLLIDDIGQSWLDIGGAICEVNAQPQMFSTMHAPMLKQLMGPTLGRIPVVVVVGDSPEWGVGQALHHFINERTLTAGLCAQDGIWIGADRIAPPGRGFFEASRVVLRDQAVECAVLVAHDRSVLDTGWPVDRCDVLVLLGDDAVLLDFSRSLSPRFVVMSALDRDNGARAASSFAPADYCLVGSEAQTGATAAVDAVAQWLSQVAGVPSLDLPAKPLLPHRPE